MPLDGEEGTGGVTSCGNLVAKVTINLQNALSPKPTH